MFLSSSRRTLGLGRFGGLISLQQPQGFGQFTGNADNSDPQQFQFEEFFLAPAAAAADGIDFDTFSQHQVVQVKNPAAHAVLVVILQVFGNGFDGLPEDLFQPQLVGLDVRAEPIVAFGPLGDAM
jgi:hypothetical protein